MQSWFRFHDLSRIVIDFYLQFSIWFSFFLPVCVFSCLAPTVLSDWVIQNHVYIGVYKKYSTCWVLKAPWCFLTLKSEKVGVCFPPYNSTVSCIIRQSTKSAVFCNISLDERKLSFIWVLTKGSCLLPESGWKEVAFSLSMDEGKLSFVWVWTKGVVFRLSLDERKLSFVWVWTKGTFKKRVNCDKS